MRRILITIEYNGKNYLGWQKNNDNKTICSVMEKAVEKIVGSYCKIVASGRTDTGVHAVFQCCHLDLPDSYKESNKLFIKNLNKILPFDIAVTSCKDVSLKFHARYNVKSKTYLYKCYTSPIRSPLKDGYYAHVPKVLNIEKIRDCAQLFKGKHDFCGFSLSDGDSKSTEREITDIKVSRHGDELLFYITGKGFLYSMVRLIVGTLIKAGENKISEEEIKNALITGNKDKVGEKMPAEGLYLYNVEY